MQHLFLRKLVIAASFCFGLATVLYADDVVMTNYILNPSFESGTTDWTVSNMKVQSNNSFTKKQGTNYLERWVSSGAAGTCSVTQKIQALPAGQYRLTAAAQNIQQDSPTTAQTGATITAGSAATTVTVVNDYNVEFGAYGEVTIGFKAVNASGNYLCVDNFRLFYIAPDLALLKEAIPAAQQVITNSEKSSYAGMQPGIKTALETAIANATNATEATSTDDLQAYAFDLAEQTALASVNIEELKSLKQLINKAKTSLVHDMAQAYKNTLQTAYDAAVAFMLLTSDEAPATIMNPLQEAYDNAEASYNAKNKLKTSITQANIVLNREGLVGADDLKAVVDEAIAMRDSETATPDEMLEMKEKLDNATLLCRVNNPTSTSAVNVKTLSAVQGATEIFGRASFSGATAKEKGFCWSESPEPTIFDNRSTTVYSNNGDIYAMQDLKPATVYYVRAYAYTSGYRLTYGDVIKVVTRPMGNVGFSYGYEGDDDQNQRIYAACEEAVWMWNNIGGIQGFYLSAHYRYGAGAGTGTAECSYGGYMSVSQNVGCQKTGTILHEGSHGLGVISYTDWVNSIYRTNGDRGYWLGPRVDRVVQFLENSATAKLNGDNQHMWPYGINGASEDSGSKILYRGNALIVEALSEDGIRHSGQDFVTPAYSFVQDDDTKYYIKSESTDRGLTTSFLRQTTGSYVRFAEATADQAFADDSYAWYIAFNPKTCYYTFKNASTGKYLSMTTGAASAASSPTSFHLLGSRNQTTYEDFTFAGTSYWIVNGSNHYAMNATTTGASSTTFNHADEAITQRWLLLTADEVTRFAESRGETVGVGALRAKTSASAPLARGGYGVIYITANSAGQDVDIYTLDGRRVSRLYVQLDATATVRVPRGLYLVNGQKVLVK